MNKAMDSKDKKYQQQVQKVLVGFDSLEEWPDYIAFLNKLQKTIQSHHRSTTNHWIPQDLDIAIILSKCLSPNLPSGVHQKSLEIYQLVFKELGIDALSSKVNVWVPGILPIIQYASISIKPIVIQLYKDFLLTLPSNILKPLIKPILSYLLCSIDDERSEFFEVSLELIDKFKTELNDDSLFWQSIFMIIITSDEKSLGALVWCNKRLPDLNIILDDEVSDIKSELKKNLTSEQLALVEPEPGLLIRSFISALKSENLLIQRGFFELLIKNLSLSSTVLQKLINKKDLQNLIISVVNTILKKDMSLNRRVWNWLLGDSDSNSLHQEYFEKYGCELLTDTLLKLINGQYYEEFIKHPYEQKISSFKICLAIMDKWEIGAIIIPKILLPFLKSIKSSQDKFQFDEVLKSGSVLFDSIETLIIFQNLFNELNNNSNSESFLSFVLTNFNFNDEEMIVHQLPILLVSVLIKNSKTGDWYELVKTILELVPQRAFLPIEHSTLEAIDQVDVVDRISAYYNENDDVLKLPFQPADLSYLLLNLTKQLVIGSIENEDPETYKYLEIYNVIIDLIPEYILKNEEILSILENENLTDPLIIIQFVKVFIKFKFEAPFIQLKILQKLVHELCFILYQKNFKYQIEVVKSIQSLTLENESYYVEAAISTYLLSLDNFNKRLEIFNYLWIHSTDVKFLNRPLFIILDDLNNNEDPNSVVKTIISKWVSNCCYNGFSNRLFQIITLKIYESLKDFELFQYYSSLLFQILRIDDEIMKLFKDELIVINSIEFQDLNGYTFKDFTIWVISKFMNESTRDEEFYNSKNLNSIFKLLETLLNFGALEINEFTLHLLKIFEISNEFISNLSNSNSDDYDLISIVLINHLTNLIKLSNNHSNNIDSIILMKTSEDASAKSLLIEFLLSSFNSFNKPELLSTLLNLLNNLLQFQNELIFQYVELISITILDKINFLYDNDNNSKDDVSISLLLTNLNEVLSLLRTYVVTLEINDPTGPNTASSSLAGHQHNSGFFTNVVSNVFNSDKPSTKDSSSIDSKSFQFRNILTDCLNKTITTCFKIWSNSDSILKKHQNYKDDYDYDGYLSLKYQSIKLKHKSKQLFESIFELEPLTVLKRLVLINKNQISKLNPINISDVDVFKLLYALDGTRPQLTMPKIFKLFNEVTSKPNGLEVVEFLNDYTSTLQDDSIEDVFNIAVAFLKDTIAIDGISKLILLRLLKLVSVLSLKLSRCKFGSEKHVKKEISDIFVKLLPLSLNSKGNKDILLASSININDKDDLSGQEKQDQSSDLDGNIDEQEEIFKSISFVVPYIKHIVQDLDKQGSLVSSILISLITKDFKSKRFPNDIKEFQLDLLNELLVHFNNVKSLKFLISETFNDVNFFKINFADLSYWNLIIKNWLNLSNSDNNANDNSSNEKLLELLTKSSQFTASSAVNIFSWNENDQNLTKLLNLRKISYILSISNKDQHVALLKELFNKLDELLTEQNASANELLSSLSSELFIMLRVIILKFSPINLINYWTFIYTSLQRFFVNLLNELNEKSSQKDGKLNLNLDTVLHACKVLDVLLVLKFEDFQEWIFVIDTINAIFKNYEIISLIDQVSAVQFPKIDKINDGDQESIDLTSKISEFRGLRTPALLGVKKIQSINSLSSFFHSLSYYNYENIYDGVNTDYESCIQDVFQDLFIV